MSESFRIEAVLHLEAVAAVVRDVLVPDDARRLRVARIVPVLAGRFPRQPFDGVTESPPPLFVVWDADRRVVVRLLGPGDPTVFDADHDCASPALRDAVVRCVEDSSFDSEVQLVLGGLLERVVFRRAQQLGNVLHHERLCTALTERAYVFTPERTPFESDSVTVER